MSVPRDPIREYIDEIDRKHLSAHERLRQALEEQQMKIDSNYSFFRDRSEADRRHIHELATNLDNLGRAPVNIDKLIFTPKVVFSILVVLLSIYGFFLASTSGMKSDLHDLATKLDAKQTTDKARADLEDVQTQGLRNAVDDLKRQVQLEQYEIQNLKDLVAKNGGGK